MKSIYTRRRRPSATDVVSLKKDNQKEQPFFGETMHEPFFKPGSTTAQPAAVQRKCEPMTGPGVKHHGAAEKT